MKERQGDERELSDLEIWNRFRSGNDAAFAFIYQAYFDKLYNYGCQFTRDHTLVEDVLQELFIELKRRAGHLSETNKIQPYLYSAFRRKLIRYRNKQSRHKALDEQKSFSIVAGVNVEESIIEDELSQENRLRIKQGVDSLSERHREIIFLFFYENLSYEEIREIQGFEHVKSARNLLYKALQSLRAKLTSLLLFLLSLPLIVAAVYFFEKVI